MTASSFTLTLFVCTSRLFTILYFQLFVSLLIYFRSPSYFFTFVVETSAASALNQSIYTGGKFSTLTNNYDKQPFSSLLAFRAALQQYWWYSTHCYSSFFLILSFMCNSISVMLTFTNYLNWYTYYHLAALSFCSLIVIVTRKKVEKRG